MFTRSFFSNQETLVEDIRQLQEDISNLKLENIQIKDKLTNLTSKVTEQDALITSLSLTQEPNQEESQAIAIQAIVVEDTPSNHPVPLSINDRVRIKNPKKKQINKGTIIGFTPTGFVKIQLDQNQGIIRRLPTNVRRIT